MFKASQLILHGKPLTNVTVFVGLHAVTWCIMQKWRQLHSSTNVLQQLMENVDKITNNGIYTPHEPISLQL